MTDIIIGQDPTKLSTNVLQPPVAVVAPPRKTFSRLYGKHDVLDGEYNLSQKLLAELIGTTLFVYGVCSCGEYCLLNCRFIFYGWSNYLYFWKNFWSSF